jgi:hypothetical protein
MCFALVGSSELYYESIYDHRKLNCKIDIFEWPIEEMQ